MKKINKRKLSSIIISIIFILIIAIIVLYKKDNLPFLVFLNSEKIKKVEKVDIIYLNRLNLGNITITGISYDEDNESFWLADYDSNINDNVITPRIIETDKEIKKVKNIIEIKGSNYNIQGISYSKNTKTLWIATGRSIINVTKDGKIIKEIEFDQNKCISNGIYYNDINDSISVLCYEKYLLNLDVYGKILNESKMDIKNQDHLTIKNFNTYISAGANYNGKNYIIVFDEENKIKKIYELKESYAIEGIVFKKNKLYVANDGLYHSAKIKDNYIVIYDLDEE